MRLFSSLFAVGRARNPSTWTRQLEFEVWDTGGWLAHGDFVFGADTDFLAVTEPGLGPRISGPGCARLEFTQSGRLLTKVLRM